MKKIFLLIIGLIIFNSCKQKEQSISGELYFKLVDFVNLYNLDEGQKRFFIEYLKDIESKEKPTESEQEFASSFNKLKQVNLESAPYIKIKTNTGKIVTVFLNNTDYSKFSIYKLNQLKNKGEKIHIELNVSEPKPSIYFCEKIIKIEAVKGETPWDK